MTRRTTCREKSNEMKSKPPVLESYGRLAADYDRRWSGYLRRTIQETLTRMPLHGGERVLEVGCGTGALLAVLAERHPPPLLSGIDPVPQMLARARDRLREEVILKEGWAEQLPFDDEQFDVVVSLSMFHYIRDPDAALAEMFRVLRPGGRLVISDWCHDYLSCRLCDWYLKWSDPAHFKTYRSAECENLLREAGFQSVASERYKINWLWGMMTATGKKPSW